MPVPSHVLVPEELPAVMPGLPVVPEFLPAAPPAPVLPPQVPADLPATGREALAAALAGPVPGAQRKAPGETVLPGDDSPLAWDDAEMARFLGVPALDVGPPGPAGQADPPGLPGRGRGRGRRGRGRQP